MKRNIIMAQFRPVKGDLGATLEHCARTIERALCFDPRPDLIVFPETALTGYFLEGAVREQAQSAAEVLRLLNAGPGSAAEGVDVVIGFYESCQGEVYNSALYATLGPSGGIRHIHRKVFLPTYGLFQEGRFVSSGSGVSAFEGGCGRTAMLICEDAWHSVTGTLAALDGARIIIILSASPARGAEPGPQIPGNLARWNFLASALAKEHGVYVFVPQLVGFEGGKGFAGGSVAFDPTGALLASGPLWEESLMEVPVDLAEVDRERARNPLLSDLEGAWPQLLSHSPGARVDQETS